MRAAEQRPPHNGGAGPMLEILIALTLVGTAALTVAALAGRRRSKQDERDESERR
jgi:type II secretory pathway pseudopilin PulG